MYRTALALLTVTLTMPAITSAQYNIGRPLSTDEIRAANITVLPDGTGLLAGHGNASEGELVYKLHCVSCHGPKGAGIEGEYPALVGGKGSLGTPKPKKTVGSYWPYATTVWDHIHRAMPFNNPHSLSVNEVYGVTAYILSLNGIIPQEQELTEKTLPKIGFRCELLEKTDEVATR